MYQKKKKQNKNSPKRQIKIDTYTLFNINRYIHPNIKACFCFYNMGMTWFIQVTITIIRNILGWKSGAVFLFHQNFLCLFWDLLSNFSSWGSWKTCLIKHPCKIYIAYLTWICRSSLWGFNSFTYERLTYSLQNLLLRLKDFLRPLHRTSMQKTSHAGGDQKSSSSCGWQSDALLEDIRHVWLPMTQNNCARPCISEATFPLGFLSWSTNNGNCCWTRQLSNLANVNLCPLAQLLLSKFTSDILCNLSLH